MKILDVLAKYELDVQASGNLFVCFCPFHDDTNRPNFTVYPDTNSWYCYTCAKGGDPVYFVSLVEGISRDAAFEKLYDNLQFLVEKLEAGREPLPCNGLISLQISRMFREFLIKQPNYLSSVLPIMRDIDIRLEKDATFDDGLTLIRHVRDGLDSLVTY